MIKYNQLYSVLLLIQVLFLLISQTSNSQEKGDDLILEAEWIANNGDSSVMHFAYDLNNVLVADDSASNNITLYPNPTNDIINFVISSEEETEISLFDLSGKFLFKKLISNKNNVINLELLNSGIYLLKIKFAKDILIKKVVKL